jgi:general secretion pathway protein N
VAGARLVGRAARARPRIENGGVGAAFRDASLAVLRISRLAITRAGASGNATIRWTNAGSALTRVAPLGAYEMRVAHTGTAFEATLRTLNGPLELEGRGGWSSGAQPAFAAIARVTSREQELAPLLRLIGVEKSDGNFELKL